MRTATERLLRRDRWIVGGGLAFVCLLSWWYLIAGSATGMNALAVSSLEFPPPMQTDPMHMDMGSVPWDPSYWAIVLVMWWIMMIGMMVPSAAPMILLYAQVYRHGERGRTSLPIVPTAAFAGGYLLAWLAFSVLATLLHWALEQSGILNRMTMGSTVPWFSGIFLIAAGVYQFSPLKEMCLSRCRSPVAFLTAHWRKSRSGAVRMGLEHGAYCVGCCWPLMLLLFVGGVMNLVWIAGLAAIVLLEKLHRLGRWIARGAGCLMVLGGVYLLI